MPVPPDAELGNSQPSLFARRARPRIAPDLLSTLLALLAQHGWRSARQLAADLDCDDRMLRALAEASHGQIISGQRGYRLTRLATVEEVNACLGALRSQGNRMLRRANLIQGVLNGRIQ